jgi:hypothetical protein
LGQTRLIRSNIESLDWVKRDSVHARMRSAVKQLLVKHDYRPDEQALAELMIATTIAIAEELG